MEAGKTRVRVRHPNWVAHPPETVPWSGDIQKDGRFLQEKLSNCKEASNGFGTDLV